MKKHNIGILIFGDPTRGGTISSETKFLANLYENNSGDCDFYILTVNPTITKKVIRDKKLSYDFPHEIITFFTDEDYYKLEHLSCVVTYPGHSNFFGGYLNDNIVKMYKIVSYCTTILNLPVFVRVNDSEIKVRDYRKMSEVRLIDGESKPDSAFMKDPLNVAKARDIVSWNEWNYKNVYWFANGSKDACDWIAETLYDREDETYRMAPRQTFVENAIYVSDDIFFLVKKNYQRFEKKYDSSMNREVKHKFCYIGFFDTVNVARSKALSVLFKDNTHKVPVKIFGKGTEILTKLNGKENIEIEEGFINGDSDEYFDFLNSHLAYIFIGKGQPFSRYIGKTAYDAVVARTPIVIYKKCDQNHITFDSDEYYFENEKELHDIFQKLKNPEIREKWIIDQAKEIFRKLPPSEFKFNCYCPVKPSIPDSLFYEVVEISKPSKKKEKIKEEVEVVKTKKSISLF